MFHLIIIDNCFLCLLYNYLWKINTFNKQHCNINRTETHLDRIHLGRLNYKLYFCKGSINFRNSNNLKMSAHCKICIKDHMDCTNYFNFLHHANNLFILYNLIYFEFKKYIYYTRIATCTISR